MTVDKRGGDTMPDHSEEIAPTVTWAKIAVAIVFSKA